jgi:hypothetical protein
MSEDNRSVCRRRKECDGSMDNGLLACLEVRTDPDRTPSLRAKVSRAEYKRRTNFVGVEVNNPSILTMSIIRSPSPPAPSPSPPASPLFVPPSPGELERTQKRRDAMAKEFNAIARKYQTMKEGKHPEVKKYWEEEVVPRKAQLTTAEAELKQVKEEIAAVEATRKVVPKVIVPPSSVSDLDLISELVPDFGVIGGASEEASERYHGAIVGDG